MTTHWPIFRLLAAALLIALLMLGMRSAQGLVRSESTDFGEVTLSESQPSVDIWSALRMLKDSDQSLTASTALSSLDRFTNIDASHSSLGPQKAAVWFAVPIRAVDGNGRWLLDIDYTALTDIKVYLADGSSITAVGHSGSKLRFADRPVHTRSFAFELELQPAKTYTLLVRIHTQSAMIVPITIQKASSLAIRENFVLVAQGLMIGIALCLLIYSAICAAAMKEPLYLMYSGMLAGSTTFFADFNGLPQMLIGFARTETVAMMSPLSVLVALACGAEFIIRSMRLAVEAPNTARALRGLTLLSIVIFVLGVSGTIGYRSAQTVATVFGPLGPLLVVPVAWKRMRAGDPIGGWMLFGWLTYVFGAVCTALMLRGLAPVNDFTQNVFQAASAVETLAWLKILGICMEQARKHANAIKNEALRLGELVRTDPLTGVLNRRGMKERLDHALHAAKPGSAVAVLLVDLDGFKPVNDTYGHDCGDHILLQVTQRIRSRIRSSDSVARTGGDEFVVVLTNIADAAQARAIAQSLVDAVAEPFCVEAVVCTIGMTIGMALSPHDARHADQLLKMADQAMYAGKRAGRGMVVSVDQLVAIDETCASDDASRQSQNSAGTDRPALGLEASKASRHAALVRPAESSLSHPASTHTTPLYH